MATQKTKASKAKKVHVMDLTWLPTEDTCIVCKKTLRLMGPFEGFFDGLKADGSKADDYEEWHMPYISIERACRSCVPVEGLTISVDNGEQFRLLPGNPRPVRL